jgi:hypothetical protein
MNILLFHLIQAAGPVAIHERKLLTVYLGLFILEIFEPNPEVGKAGSQRKGSEVFAVFRNREL